MKLIHLIGPHCVRAQQANEIISAGHLYGFSPVVYIAPNNKSTFIISDYMPQAGQSLPTYEEILQYAAREEITDVIVRATNIEHAVSTIQAVLQANPRGTSFSYEHNYKLFAALDYLMSVLMFNDSMPDMDLTLSSIEYQNTRHDLWKVKPLLPQTNVNAPRREYLTVITFLTANAIAFVPPDDPDEYILVDIFQFAKTLLRIGIHPTITPWFRTLQTPIVSTPNLICPITKQRIQNPYIAADGHTYEESAIRGWIAAGNMRSPVTGRIMPNLPLVPNYQVRTQMGAEPQTAPLFAPVVPYPNPKV